MCQRLLFLCSLLCCAVFSSAQQQTMRTQYTNIHFDETQIELVNYISDHVDRLVEELYQRFEPTYITPIDLVIYHDQLSFNAFANTALEPVVGFYATPFLNGELHDNGDYVLSTLKHEFAHLVSARVMGSQASELSNIMQNIFWTPNAVVPSGFQEGIAQLIESDFDSKSGRAYRLNSYYNSLWLSEWRKGFISFDRFAATYNRQSHVSAYLYGAYFFSYVEERFGKDAIYKWLKSRSDDINFVKNPFLDLDYSWQQAYTEPLEETWRQFIQSESQRLAELYGEPNSDIKTEQTFAGQYRRESLVSLTFSHGSLFSLMPTLKQGVQTFALRKDNELITRFRLPGAQQVELVNENELYYLQADTCKGKEVTNLVYYQIDKKQHRVLTECVQIFSFAIDVENSRAALLEKTEVGSSIKTLSLDGDELSQHWQGDFQQIVSDLVFSPSGDDLIIALKPNLKSAVNLWRLDLTTNSLTMLTNDAYVQRSPSFNGTDKLVYSREHNGIELPFELNLLTGEEALLADVNQPLLAPKALGSLYALTLDNFNLKLVSLEYSPKGITQQHQFSEAVTGVEKANLSTKNRLTQPYRFVENFKLQGVLPTLGFSSDYGLDIGPLFVFRDPLGNHAAQARVVANTDSGGVSASLSYLYKDRLALKLIGQQVDDSYTSGYQVSWQNFKQASSAKLGYLTQLTNLYEISTDANMKNQWLGGGVSLGAREHCFDASLYCRGYYAALLAENRNGLNGEANSDTLVGLKFEGYLPMAQGLTTKLSVDSRASLEAGLVSLASQDESFLLQPLLRRSFAQRGYKAGLTDTWLTQFDLRLIKQWQIGEAMGTFGYALDSVNAAPYVTTGIDRQQQTQTTIGLEYGIESTVGWGLPFALTVGIAHGLDDGLDADFYFIGGFEF